MSSKIEEFNFNSSFQSIVDSNPSGITNGLGYQAYATYIWGHIQ